MPRNGSGVYAGPSGGFNPPVSGQPIGSAAWQAMLDDIEGAISASIASDGQTPTTAKIPFAAGLSIHAGSAAAPSINFIGDTNTGIYASGADIFGVTVGGVARQLIGVGSATLSGRLRLSGVFGSPVMWGATRLWRETPSGHPRWQTATDGASASAGLPLGTVAQNLTAAEGAVQLGDLHVKWKEITTSGTDWVTWTFDDPFPTAIFGAVGSVNSPGGSTNFALFGSPDASSVQVRAVSDSGTLSPRTVFAIAIGN